MWGGFTRSVNKHYKDCTWSDPDCKTGPDTSESRRYVLEEIRRIRGALEQQRRRRQQQQKQQQPLQTQQGEQRLLDICFTSRQDDVNVGGMSSLSLLTVITTTSCPQCRGSVY